MKDIIIYLTLVISQAVPALGQQSKDTSILKNFDYFIKFYDKNYGLFEEKGINWKFLTNKYRSKINEKISRDSLYKIMCELVEHLNDPHVYIDNGVSKYISGGGMFN